VSTLQPENASLRHQLDVICQRLVDEEFECADLRRLQLLFDQLANETGPMTDPLEHDATTDDSEGTDGPLCSCAERTDTLEFCGSVVIFALRYRGRTFRSTDASR
jgi:hypothetical protein